jgi:hypothetical protein
MMADHSKKINQDKNSKPTNPTVNTGSVGRQCKKKIKVDHSCPLTQHQKWGDTIMNTIQTQILNKNFKNE